MAHSTKMDCAAPFSFLRFHTIESSASNINHTPVGKVKCLFSHFEKGTRRIFKRCQTLFYVETKIYSGAFGKTPRGPRCARQARQRLASQTSIWVVGCQTSKTRVRAWRLAAEIWTFGQDALYFSCPDQGPSRAPRAAAEQLFSHLWWPRAARAKGSG